MKPDRPPTSGGTASLNLGEITVIKAIRILAVSLGALWAASPASAASTVECHSVNYAYTECSAGSLSSPQLVHQISSSSCILNRTWGYNPRSGYLWVAEGCSGVFADMAGYHYGRDDGYDPNARMYNDRGHDVGAVVGGAVVAALINGMVNGGHNSGKHETSNYSPHTYTPSSSGYTGCHGMGCLVGSSAPPEPGQSQFRSEDSPPEPGQQQMSGPEN